MKRVTRLLRVFILTAICVVMAACVKEENGRRGPLNTEEGRQEAVQAYINLAFGYVNEGQTEQAKEPLLEALKIDKNSAEANAAIAYVFQIERSTEKADEYFKKALATDPNNARILNNYGVFLFEQNRLDEAKKAFLKATEDSFYSGRSVVFENLGLIALRQNNSQQAEENFKQSLLLNRGRPVSILGLADIFYRKKDYPSALKYYNAYIDMMGGNQSPQGLLLGIRILNATNNKAKSASYASQLERLYPKSIEYREYKAGSK